MKTTKTKIKNGYEVTREDGAKFRVTRHIISGKKAWITENAAYETDSDRTFSAAICSIENKHSKVAGWEKKIIARSKSTGLYFNGTNFTGTKEEAIALRPGTTAADFAMSWGGGVEIEHSGIN